MSASAIYHEDYFVSGSFCTWFCLRQAICDTWVHWNLFIFYYIFIYPNQQYLRYILSIFCVIVLCGEKLYTVYVYIYMPLNHLLIFVIPVYFIHILRQSSYAQIIFFVNDMYST